MSHAPLDGEFFRNEGLLELKDLLANESFKAIQIELLGEPKKHSHHTLVAHLFSQRPGFLAEGDLLIGMDGYYFVRGPQYWTNPKLTVEVDVEDTDRPKGLMRWRLVDRDQGFEALSNGFYWDRGNTQFRDWYWIYGICPFPRIG